MQTKLQVYVALAEDTARKITSDYLDWASYLTMASRLYKYPYQARREGHRPADTGAGWDASAICV